MNFCPTCGRSLEGAVRFCFGCGTDLAAAGAAGAQEVPAHAPPAAPQPPASPPPAAPQAPAPQMPPAQQMPAALPMPPAGAPMPAAGYAPAAMPAGAPGQMSWQQNRSGRFAFAPPELLAVCALMAIAGGLTLWPVIRILPDIFDLFDAGEFGRDLGLLLLTVWVVLGLFGVACLLLAWRMGHADRVARGLTHVLLGGLGASILIGDVHDWQLIVVMLVCFGSMAVLQFAPRVQAYFTGPGARQYDQVASVVTARVLVAVWASIMVLVGAMFLPLSDIGQKFLVVGVFLVALGVAGFILNQRLSSGEPLSRILVSVGAVIYIVLMLVVDRRDPGMILPLSVGLGVVYFLWFPRESREFFAAGSIAHPLPGWMQAITAPGGSAPAPYAQGVPYQQSAPYLPAAPHAPAAAQPTRPPAAQPAYPPAAPAAAAPAAFYPPAPAAEAAAPAVPAAEPAWRDPAPAAAPSATRACRTPDCTSRDVPTDTKFCADCGQPTA